MFRFIKKRFFYNNYLFWLQCVKFESVKVCFNE